MFSFIKRKSSPAAAGAPDEVDSVQAARTRARRRLIGAAVLVGLGVVGFPLLFETQPRPIAVDIPIEAPVREAVPPSVPPPGKSAAATPAKPPLAAEPVDVAPAVSAPLPTTSAAAASARLEPTGPAVEEAEVERAAPVAAPPPATARPSLTPEQRRDAQRAQALLEGKPVPPQEPGSAGDVEAKAGRFVVQAGAYTDSSSLRDARQKVEKLGLKTYTQVIETNSGARTRVRVGPFATREEAEKAAARIKGTGLATSILSL